MLFEQKQQALRSLRPQESFQSSCNRRHETGRLNSEQPIRPPPAATTSSAQAEVEEEKPANVTMLALVSPLAHDTLIEIPGERICRSSGSGIAPERFSFLYCFLTPPRLSISTALLEAA
jgi:hypothetical protein